MTPAIWELVRMRFKQLQREPGHLFWNFVFPLFVAVSICYAVRNGTGAPLTIAVVPGGDRDAGALVTELSGDELAPVVLDEADARGRLKRGLVALIIFDGVPPRIVLDPAQPDARTARLAIVNALRKAAALEEPALTVEHSVQREARYVDFLVPGLMSANLLVAAMWGVGVPTQQWRRMKLYKRFAATPAPRAAVLGSYFVPYVAFSLVSTILFILLTRMLIGFHVAGAIPLVLLLATLGSACFIGLAILCASAAKSESVSMGLINVASFPQLMLGEAFFSLARFPSWLQNELRLLPMSILNQALRTVILDSGGAALVWPHLLGLSLWAVFFFVLASRSFKWT